MGNLFCTGLSSGFLFASTPLNGADNSLSAVMNVNVFNGHFLLALSSVSVQVFHLRRIVWVRIPPSPNFPLYSL